MQSTARAPGTCGELIQGTLAGTNFLVTCPINLYSVVNVTLTEDKAITVIGGGSDKVVEAVHKAMQLLAIKNKGAQVRITSEIPRGKGMASSTADISATVAAVARAAGDTVTPGQIADIALQIEPSDGVMFSGITIFDHIQGKIQTKLGPAPAMEMVIVDLGGQIDTREFNRRQELPLLNKENEPKIVEALAFLKKGYRENNLNLIAQAATMSAFANQKILFKEKLPEIYELARQMGALGINVAHSGTVVGLIFLPGQVSADIEKHLKKLLSAGCQIYRAHLVNGGIEVLSAERREPFWEKLNMYTGETYEKPQSNTV